MSTLQNFYESAATSRDLVTHSANDPMTPITGEAASEFPISFIGNAVSGNPGDIAQGDDALTSTNDLSVNSNEALLEKCNAPGDNSLPKPAENDNGGLQEEDVGCADLKLRHNLLLEEHGTADTTTTVALQVDETTMKGESIESDKHSAIHQKDELKFEEGRAEDLFRPLERATSNAEENNDDSSKEGGNEAKSKAKTDEGIPEEDDVGQTRGENMYSKQSSCNCASEIHLASSPHSNKLVKHNAAFERNSLNEGGAMVKMLGLGEEKCPAWCKNTVRIFLDTAFMCSGTTFLAIKKFVGTSLVLSLKQLECLTLSHSNHYSCSHPCFGNTCFLNVKCNETHLDRGNRENHILLTQW